MITTTVRNNRDHFAAFEIGILRRLNFKSVLMPICETPHLGYYLKRFGARILTNDILPSGWTNSLALIQNNDEVLAPDDFETVLRDAYVHKTELMNPVLANWFSHLDATWFDNIRKNIEQLPRMTLKSVAASLVMGVGDYALSFSEETRKFRQPLSNVFREISKRRPTPINNFQQNVSSNMPIREFIAENHADLLYLRLPHSRNASIRDTRKFKAWRDEWLLEGNEFWKEIETKNNKVIGSHVVSKGQYLQQVEELLKTASHIRRWAVVHAEDAFVNTADLVEVIGGIRRLDNIYTKDFTEVLGTKVSVITA